jgi:hypothetical protein
VDGAKNLKLQKGKIRNALKVFKCGAREGSVRSAGQIMWKKKTIM